ncbi:MAG: fibronectin type III domain-containing protein [Syntrophobacteraceae bacterium]
MPLHRMAEAITSYTVTSNPTGGNDTNAGSASSPHIVANLKNGTAYTFTVTATNTKGLSTSSKPSQKIMTWTVASQPAITSLTAGNGQVTVKFSAPKSNGGSAITGYTVASNPTGGNDSNAGAGPTVFTHTVDNLQNGTPYTFTVTATNSVGPSTSKASKSITPATVPDAPTNVSATQGSKKGTVIVTFGQPNSNGSPIKSYTVSTPENSKIKVTRNSTQITVTGLTSGQSYTFSVVATNSMGPGSTGTSNSVTAP